jgi:hypothetical protein
MAHMQRLTMVRYAIKPDRVEENESLCRAVFDELRANSPEGVFYSCYKEADGAAFVHLFVNLREDDAEAVTGLASFATYQAKLRDRWVAPPEATRLSLELLDSYGLASR